MFILGNFNINLFKMASHPDTKDFLSTMYSNYCFPIISKPTKVNDKTATLTYNIFANSLNEAIHSGILVTDICDHFPVFLIFFS